MSLLTIDVNVIIKQPFVKKLMQNMHSNYRELLLCSQKNAR